MTGRQTVFREVDRSVKQMKFHLTSYLIPDRKAGINSNNLPKSEVRNLCFETLSVWIDWMMDEWKSKQDKYLLEGTHPAGRVPFQEIFGCWQYSFQATGFPTCRNNGQRWERNEFCRNDYHRSSERVLAEPGIEPATSCSKLRNATDWAMGLGVTKFFKDHLHSKMNMNWKDPCQSYL